MAYPEAMKDIHTCVALGVPSRVPSFPLCISYDYDYFGYTHARWRNDPEVMLALARRAVGEFDYDVYMLHPDDLIEYEGTGIRIKFEEKLPPAVQTYLPADEATLSGLTIPANLTTTGRMAAHLEGLSAIKEALGDSICLVGRVAAPFSTLTLILGIEATLLLMLEDPALLKRYMEFFLEYNDVVAAAQLKAGADALWLGDCVATSHFISPQQYEDHAAELAAASAGRNRERGGIVFYHGDENSLPHLKIMARLGFDALNIGAGADMEEVKGEIGSQICIMGNLDTVNDLQPSSPREVEQMVREIVEAAKPGGGYIFCTAEGVTDNTPVENVRAMMRAVKQYGKY
jgi:MtaA/CmuA family methyltransferase